MHAATIQPRRPAGDTATVLLASPPEGFGPISHGVDQTGPTTTLVHDQVFGSTEAAARAHTVPEGTSTSAAGWVEQPPLNRRRTIGELLSPSSAPPASIDRTPFRTPAMMNLWGWVRRPMSSVAGGFSGVKYETDGPEAAAPPGRQSPVYAARGNSYRLTPQPWDTQVFTSDVPVVGQ